MRGFRFRAQAALDLRRREHDAAQRALADAQARLSAARTAWHESARVVAQAQEEAAHAMSSPGSSISLSWHRSWMLRLEHERVACARVVSARETELAGARDACARTQQRVKALERFFEKARTEWDRAALHEEAKEMDMLATLRFAARRTPGV